MATTPALLTVEQFLALPEIEGIRRELSDGELIETDMGNAGWRHEWIKSNFGQIFAEYMSAHRTGKVFSESLFKLGTNRARIPDVSVILNAQSPMNDGPIEGSPDIAVEIVSSESARDLEAKIEQLLESGTKFVLVAYPEVRVIRVFGANGNSSLIREDQFLELPDLLPGFRVQVAKFFEGI
jgi:Uma2 family endonuclease